MGTEKCAVVISVVSDSSAGPTVDSAFWGNLLTFIKISEGEYLCTKVILWNLPEEL